MKRRVGYSNWDEEAESSSARLKKLKLDDKDPAMNLSE